MPDKAPGLGCLKTQFWDQIFYPVFGPVRQQGKFQITNSKFQIPNSKQKPAAKHCRGLGKPRVARQKVSDAGVLAPKNRSGFQGPKSGK